MRHAGVSRGPAPWWDPRRHYQDNQRLFRPKLNAMGMPEKTVSGDDQEKNDQIELAEPSVAAARPEQRADRNHRTSARSISGAEG
jgi:hypothetical protein